MARRLALKISGLVARELDVPFGSQVAFMGSPAYAEAPAAVSETCARNSKQDPCFGNNRSLDTQVLLENRWKLPVCF